MPKRPKQNSDHPHRHHTPTIDNEAIANHLEALLTPAVYAQQKYYKQLGLRDRVLNLSLMVAAVLTLLWRQVPGVQELNRLLAREGLLWCPVTKVAQQSLSERFLVFPSELFERVFKLDFGQKNWFAYSLRTKRMINLIYIFPPFLSNMLNLLIRNFNR
ncbi:IS4 transposase [Nostoc flagelliforme CCNUN1]|uniref:IS4 transposase n=1 Tax=Nostoc flagelliforme CCNUN1 TaxID=2038116 RepID=A0A2K8T2V6_9NOSO|nr:IS4 transposase [Nostoc flagelliforme CCNUN1]